VICRHRPLQESSVAPASERSGRIDWLDGVRGLAALYVVLHHALAMSVACDPRVNVDFPYACVFASGSNAVVLFLCLSGYCLMRPVHKSLLAGGTGFSSGILSFIVRRARRILPVYYVCLAIAVSLIAFHAHLNRGELGHNAWVSPTSIAHHIFLTYDLLAQPLVRVQLDPPMWSLAVEWHIYFLFPIMILIWRKWGFVWSLLTTYALSQVVYLSAPIDEHYMAYPTVFLLGCAAYMVAQSDSAVCKALRSRVPWLAVAALGVCFQPTINDVLLTLTVYAPLLIGLSESRFWGNVAGCRPLAFLGRISYPLYLIHFPIMALWLNYVDPIVSQHGQMTYPYLVVAGSALSLLGAWILHVLVERPFMVPSRPLS